MHESTRTALRAAALLATIAILAACARTGAPSASAEPSESAASQRPAASVREFQTPPPSVDPLVGEVPAEVLNPILAAAAEVTGVPIGEIQVVQAEQVTWSDGSLGCPEPGQFYTQALVDGYQVVLNAGGDELDYRVGSGGSFNLCENGLPRGG